MLSCFSHIQLFATLQTIPHLAPLSMGFSRQEYQSELPFLPPGDLPNPEIEPESTVSPVFQGDSLLTEPLGKLTFSVEPRALLCRGSNREA